MPGWLVAGGTAAVVLFVACGAGVWALLNACEIARVGQPDAWIPFLIALAKAPKGTLSAAPWQFHLRFYTPLFVALAGGAWFAWLVYRAQVAAADGNARHLRGRRYIKDPRAAAKAFKGEMRPGDGLQIHPKLPPLSYANEPLHTFFLGGVGAGKTQTLIPWIQAARARADKVLIHDVKGDFTAGLSAPFVLIAPWDSRGAVWAVAEDVRTKSNAREFAERLIPDNKQSPMWPAAARQVLVGLCIALQSEKPLRWGFGDMAALAAKPMEELLQIMQRHNPEAIRALEGQNVTTAGILINLMSFLSPVFDLAAAWPAAPEPGKGFSMTRWLTTTNCVRTVILQNSGQFSLLSKGLNAAMIGLAAQVVASPSLPDSTTRRIWFMLDEFPTLGRLDPVESLIALGRSKGIRVVLLAQALDLLKEVYGNNKAAAWLAMVGNVIIGRTAGDTAKWLSEEVIERREVERTQTSSTPGAQRGGLLRDGVGRTYSTHRTSELVVMPSELSADLGANEKGVHILWITGSYALRLLVPFSTMPATRPSSCMAKWTQWPAESRLPSAQVAPQDELPEVLAKAGEPEQTRIAAKAVIEESTDITAPRVQLQAAEPSAEEAEGEGEGKAVAEIAEHAALHVALGAAATPLGALLGAAEIVATPATVKTSVANVSPTEKRRRLRLKSSLDDDLAEET